MKRRSFNERKKLKKISKNNNKFIVIIYLLSFFLIIYSLVDFSINYYKIIILKNKMKKNGIKELNLDYNYDEITLVSAFYITKSKYTFYEYLSWINNLVKLNCSMVFFTEKKFINILKELRPKELHYKTIFIETEIEEFYSYQNFLLDFNKAFNIDPENSNHSVSQYLILAEKVNFLKKVITKNYFYSRCFYWIDASYFKEKNITNLFENNWPSSKKCYEDPRLLMNSIRKIEKSEFESLKNLDSNPFRGFIKLDNIAGNIFGGQPKNIIKFADLYYDTLRLFIENNIFIGKENNIYAFIAHSHPEIVNLIESGNILFFQKFLS